MKAEVDLSGARAKMGKLKTQMNPAIHRKLEHWGAKTEQRLKQYTLAGEILSTGTGELKRNVGYKTAVTETIVSVAVGTAVRPGTKSVKYARIQDKGGEIVPKTAKALTIPFRGVKGRARNYPGAFIIKAKGKAFIVRRRGEGLEWLYTLKQKVRIPARHWLSRTVKDMLPYLNQLLKPETLKRAMGIKD